MLLAIPSPDSELIAQVGALKIRWYGTLIALSILLAIRLARVQMQRRGLDPERAYTVATWAVPGGVIGARLYHVITTWEHFSGNLAKIPALWEGGLGMPGVIAGGALGAFIGARRAGVPVLAMFDCIAPGLILAQAIGRWGNYFNQELFGGPTDLPWGLEIAPERRPAAFQQSETFHPTFLYESLWNLAVFVLLWRASRRHSTLAPGAVFALYLVAYSFGRFFIEGLRVDFSHEIGPMRVNQWLFGTVFVLAGLWLLRLRRRRPATAPVDSAVGA